MKTIRLVHSLSHGRPTRRQVAAGLLAAPVALAAQLRRSKTGALPEMTERVFSLNDYGADPTGATLSDNAWTEAYKAAANAVQTHAGAMITCDPGFYNFTLGVVKITDARIGFVADGKGAVTLSSPGGDGGDLVAAVGGGNGGPAAPIGGFALYGWNTGGATTGLRVGDRNYGTLFDISARGFTGAGSAGIRAQSTTSGGIEGTEAYGLDAENCATALCLDGLSPTRHTSCDYTTWDLHTVACGTALRVVNGGHNFGGRICLHGNLGGPLWPRSTLVAVGADAGDTAWLGCALDIGAEADSGSGSVVDFVVQGASTSAGLINCHGGINLVDGSAVWQAGSVAGARMSFLGLMQHVPVVAASGGTKEPLGPFAYSKFDSAGIWT
jgi:hypothetical protein